MLQSLRLIHKLRHPWQVGESGSWGKSEKTSGDAFRERDAINQSITQLMNEPSTHESILVGNLLYSPTTLALCSYYTSSEPVRWVRKDGKLHVCWPQSSGKSEENRLASLGCAGSEHPETSTPTHLFADAIIHVANVHTVVRHDQLIA